MLNDTLDNGLGPVHATWKALWNAQQNQENLISMKTQARDQTDMGLDQNVSRVKNALEITQGKGSPVLKQYLPDGKAEVNKKPLARALTLLDPYLGPISGAPDSIIPTEVKDAFLAAVEAARSAQAALDSAKKSGLEAQRLRAEADGAWLAAYEDYHRAVEFVCAGDRGRIKQWIKEWPEPGSSGEE